MLVEFSGQGSALESSPSLFTPSLYNDCLLVPAGHMTSSFSWGHLKWSLTQILYSECYGPDHLFLWIGISQWGRAREKQLSLLLHPLPAATEQLLITLTHKLKFQILSLCFFFFCPNFKLFNGFNRCGVFVCFYTVCFYTDWFRESLLLEKI